MVSGVYHKGLPAVLNGPDIIREYSVENSSFSRFGCGVRVVMRPVHPVVYINGFENFDYNLQFFFRGRELIVIKDSLNLVDHIADGCHFYSSLHDLPGTVVCRGAIYIGKMAEVILGTSRGID
jgi:hypothetical protein